MKRSIERFMAHSLFAGLFLILLCLQGCSGPETPPEEEPSGNAASQELPPDQQAFYATYAIKEPEERLKALNAFVSDFPDSGSIYSAYREIFKLTIELFPEDREKILNTAAVADTIDDQLDRSYGYLFVATELFKAGIFPEDAETFALKSIQLLDKNLYIEKEKQNYLENERDVPTSAELEEEYIKERAAYRTALGRIYLENGKVNEGEKILKEAYEIDPLIAQAGIGLAEIAQSRGQDDKALEYLTTAALTAGYEMDDARSRIEALFRKTHNGSIDGLEPMLDAAYRRLFPNPVEVQPFSPSANRSNRVVLAEYFTGAG